MAKEALTPFLARVNPQTEATQGWPCLHQVLSQPSRFHFQGVLTNCILEQGLAVPYPQATFMTIDSMLWGEKGKLFHLHKTGSQMCLKYTHMCKENCNLFVFLLEPISLSGPQQPGQQS